MGEPMNNYINYYYNLYPVNIHYRAPYFYFMVNNKKYYLVFYERPLPEIKPLYELSLFLLKQSIAIHQIILNKDRQPLTFINNKPYVLLKINGDETRKVTLDDINYLHLIKFDAFVDPLLMRTDWGKLWSKKIDYLEYQFHHIANKFPLVADCLSYFIGLGENAIAYVNNTKHEVLLSFPERFTISHKRINIDDTCLELYNPLNFILDYQVRDIAAYIKMAFFAELNLWAQIKAYFTVNQFSPYSLRLLYARLLYPSYFFDQYELVITGQDDPESLNRIITKMPAYEKFLQHFYYYLNHNNNMPPIEWLHKSFNQP